MVELYFIAFAAGAICGIIGMYNYFELKYIDKLDKPITHILSIEVDEGGPYGTCDTNLNETR